MAGGVEKIGDDSEGQAGLVDYELKEIEVYGEIHDKIDVMSTIRNQGKFLWEFSIYSLIWPTYTPKGE